MKRELTPVEKKVLEMFAEKLDGPKAAQLLMDLEHASVVGDSSRIIFDIEGYDRPAYQGQHTLGEGRAYSRGGGELSILLHADENDRLLELEIIDWESDTPMDPDWDSLVVF